MSEEHHRFKFADPIRRKARDVPRRKVRVPLITVLVVVLALVVVLLVLRELQVI